MIQKKGKIQYGTITIPYYIIKSKRVKTSEIIVDSDKVTIRTPLNKNLSEIRRIVSDKASWILKKQKEYKDAIPQITKPTAIECFDKALQVDPKNPYAWTNKGYVLHGLGKYKEAIEYYDKALQVDPNNILALNIKGAALNKLGRHKEAKELTQKKQGWKRWFR